MEPADIHCNEDHSSHSSNEILQPEQVTHVPLSPPPSSPVSPTSRRYGLCSPSASPELDKSNPSAQWHPTVPARRARHISKLSPIPSQSNFDEFNLVSSPTDIEAHPLPHLIPLPPSAPSTPVQSIPTPPIPLFPCLSSPSQTLPREFPPALPILSTPTSNIVTSPVTTTTILQAHVPGTVAKPVEDDDSSFASSSHTQSHTHSHSPSLCTSSSSSLDTLYNDSFLRKNEALLKHAESNNLESRFSVSTDGTAEHWMPSSLDKSARRIHTVLTMFESSKLARITTRSKSSFPSMHHQLPRVSSKRSQNRQNSLSSKTSSCATTTVTTNSSLIPMSISVFFSSANHNTSPPHPLTTTLPSPQHHPLPPTSPVTQANAARPSQPPLQPSTTSQDPCAGNAYLSRSFSFPRKFSFALFNRYDDKPPLRQQISQKFHSLRNFSPR